MEQVTYLFEDFALDPARFELRKGAQTVAVEPQVLSVLILLVSNPDRLVSRDELVEKVWHGRIVSEAAISARIKSARKALDDSGHEQRLIKTVHGRGFRFVGTLKLEQPIVSVGVAQPDAASEAGALDKGVRPSIAVLPFAFHGADSPYTFLADAFPDEILTDLARLRWLSVIARGTSFRFRGEAADPVAVGEALGARYCVTGSVTPTGSGMRFSVELVACADGAVVWSESLIVGADELDAARADFVRSIVSNIDHHIPLHEANAVRGRPMYSLDAWSSFYLGYDLLFRFNRADNDYALQLLKRASDLDQNFSRAYAGLSFAHHQNYFMQYHEDHATGVALARDYAQRALDLDRTDPFAHFNMGRSAWVDGRLRDSIEWLDQATTLSPSYAQGLYARSWAEAVCGEFEDGEKHAREALKLSPLDPLRYAMVGTVALARLGQGDLEKAAELGERSARTPGAHKHIALIAAIAKQANGETEAAQGWLARAREMDPAISSAMFLKSFPFEDSALREKVLQALGELGA